MTGLMVECMQDMCGLDEYGVLCMSVLSIPWAGSGVTCFLVQGRDFLFYISFQCHMDFTSVGPMCLIHSDNFARLPGLEWTHRLALGVIHTYKFDGHFLSFIGGHGLKGRGEGSF